MSMDEWQALYQQLASLISHQELMDTVLPALAHLLPATQAELYLSHESSPFLTLVGTWGLEGDIAAVRAESVQAGPAGWVMQYGQPLVIGDASPNPPMPVAAGFPPHLLYVPLQRRDHCLGVLGVGRPVQPFTPADVATIQTLAGQVALVAENIALRRQQGPRSEDLAGSRHSADLQRFQAQASLIQVSQVLNTASSLEDVLDRVLEAGFSLLGEREGSIILLDEQTNTLHIVASRGITPETVAAFNTRPVYAHEGTYAEAIRTGCIMEVLDTAADSHFLRDRGSVAQQVTNVPLRIGQRVIGILALDTLPADDQDREMLQALADMAAVAIEKARLLEQAQREARENQQLASLVRDQLHKSARLYEISTRLHAAQDLETLLHNAATSVVQVFDASAVEITLFNAAGELDVRMAAGLSDALVQETVPRSGGSVRTIWRTGQPLIVSDTNLAPAMIHPQLRQAGFRALLGLPLPGKASRTLPGGVGGTLQGQEHVLGVVRVLFDQPQPLLWDEVDTVAVYVNQIAVAIENVRLYRNLEDLLMETIRALVHAFEAKDQYSAQHSEEVMRYAMALARELGFDDSRCWVIQFGALLHDIGKIGVGDQILLKETLLDTNEWFLMRTHPTLGAEIVKGIRPLRDVVEMIRHHHERFDGRGYPDGLAGNTIPLEARMLAVVDAFESMTSDRAYRKAISVGEALERLEAGADAQWDGRIVKVWCDMVRREGQKLLGIKWDLLTKDEPQRPRRARVHSPSLIERSSTAHLPGEDMESVADSIPHRTSASGRGIKARR